VELIGGQHGGEDVLGGVRAALVNGDRDVGAAGGDLLGGVLAFTSSASWAGVKLARTFSKMISLLVMAIFLSGLGGLYTVSCCLLWLECNTVPCKCQAFF
jgi:hypothetical protein